MDKPINQPTPIVNNQQTETYPVNESSPPIKNNHLPLPNKRKNLKIVFFSILSLTLIASAIFYFYKKNSSKNLQALPYESNIVASNPREKFEQIIVSNPVFSQLEMSSTPIAPVAEKHDQGAQAMLSLKSTLNNNETITDSLKKQTLIKIDGALTTNNPQERQDFSLKASVLQLLQNKGGKSLTDLILNGSIGSANFDDENQDGLHISLTQTDKNNSYLKVNMSDYLLIFANSLMNPNQVASPQISFETDEIWPFLGQYLHIPRSVELIRYGSKLKQEDQVVLEKIREETEIAFKKTLGNIESYINITESQQETSSTNLEGTIDPNKLAAVITSYFVKTKEIMTNNADDIRPLCTTLANNNMEAENCLTELDAPAITREEIEAYFASLITFFQFQPIKATINNQSLTVEKFSFQLTFNNQIDPETGSWLVLTPFSTVSINITSDLKDAAAKEISAPQKTVSILSVGNNEDSFINNSYQEETVQGDLYRENKQYLLASYDTNQRFCGGLTGQEYCLDASGLWSDFLNQEGDRNTLRMTQKNPDTSNYRSTSITITQTTTNSFTSKCVYPDSQEKTTGIKMINYTDITTADNIQLRFSEPEKNYDSESVYYYVCAAKNGVYYDITPYGKILIGQGPLNYEGLIKEIEPVLASLTFTNSNSLKSSQETTDPTAPTPSPDPTEKYSFSNSVRKVEVGSQVSFLLYGTGMGDPGVCYTRSQFLIDAYDTSEDATFVVPSGYGICIAPNECAICNNGDFSNPTSDLTMCAQQICQ
jgi:hypothetical protein